MNGTPSTLATAFVTGIGAALAPSVVAWAKTKGLDLSSPAAEQALAGAVAVAIGTGTGWVMAILDSFVAAVTAVNQAIAGRMTQVIGKVAAPSVEPPKQAGFASVGMIALLAVLALPFVGGCGFMMQKQEPLPDSKVLTMPGDEALKAIVLAKEGLDVAANFIADSTNQGLLDPAQGRKWFEELKTYRARLAEAEKLLSSGSFDAAKMQAAGTQALIKFIHDQAIEAVKRSAAPKPAGLVQILWQEEFQPTRRFAWTR